MMSFVPLPLVQTIFNDDVWLCEAISLAFKGLGQNSFHLSKQCFNIPADVNDGMTIRKEKFVELKPIEPRARLRSWIVLYIIFSC